jgi:hypothetical protein
MYTPDAVEIRKIKKEKHLKTKLNDNSIHGPGVSSKIKNMQSREGN